MRQRLSCTQGGVDSDTRRNTTPQPCSSFHTVHQHLANHETLSISKKNLLQEGAHHDDHLKLAPAVLLDLKRVHQHLAYGIMECWVQAEFDLCPTTPGYGIAFLFAAGSAAAFVRRAAPTSQHISQAKRGFKTKPPNCFRLWH